VSRCLQQARMAVRRERIRRRKSSRPVIDQIIRKKESSGVTGDSVCAARCSGVLIRFGSRSMYRYMRLK